MDLEAVLERDLLVAGLREHVTAPLVQGHFAAHRDQYDRVHLGQIVVARADLARELRTQIHRQAATSPSWPARIRCMRRPATVAGSWACFCGGKCLGTQAVFCARGGDRPVALPASWSTLSRWEHDVRSRAGRGDHGADPQRAIRRVVAATERLGGARPGLPLLEAT